MGLEVSISQGIFERLWNRNSENYWKQLEENPEPIFKEEFQAAKERLEKERGQLGNFELMGLRNIVKEVLAHSLAIHKLGKTSMGIFTPMEIIQRFNAQFDSVK